MLTISNDSPMPLYVFTLSRSANEDRVEVDLRYRQHAWQEAVMSFDETIKDIDGNLDFGEEQRLTVSDSDGSLLFELSCANRQGKP